MVSAGRSATLQWFSCGMWLEAPAHTQVQGNVSSLTACTGTAASMLSEEVWHRQPGPCQEETVNLGQAVRSAELRDDSV